MRADYCARRKHTALFASMNPDTRGHRFFRPSPRRPGLPSVTSGQRPTRRLWPRAPEMRARNPPEMTSFKMARPRVKNQETKIKSIIFFTPGGSQLCRRIDSRQRFLRKAAAAPTLRFNLHIPWLERYPRSETVPAIGAQASWTLSP